MLSVIGAKRVPAPAASATPAMLAPMLRSVPALVAAIGILAAACGSGEEATAPDASTLDWEDCDGIQCATLDVPLDHSDPDGATITVELNRDRADDPEARVGVLLVNPGGPGGSGRAMARSYAARHPELGDAFDIVGWDPRGVSGTSELTCDDGLQAFYALDNDPDDAAELEALRDQADSAAAECAADSTFLVHVGSGAVVDDMDLIRMALGEDQISYLGTSYGSVLGLGYATRYGPNLRAAVLDGVTDPAHDMQGWLTSQAVATEAALVAILGDLTLLEETLREAEAADVSPSDVARAAISATYDPTAAGGLAEALRAHQRGDRGAIEALSDRYLGSAGFDVYTAVKCVDLERPDGLAAFAAMVDTIAADAPVLGPAIANELLPCAAWRVDPVVPFPVISDAEAPSLVILGNTGDAATPHGDAVAVAQRLDDARLVTFEGDGHLSFGRGSDCVDDAVVAYLIDLALPEPDLRCN